MSKPNDVCAPMSQVTEAALHNALLPLTDTPIDRGSNHPQPRGPFWAMASRWDESSVEHWVFLPTLLHATGYTHYRLTPESFTFPWPQYYTHPWCWEKGRRLARHEHSPPLPIPS